MNIGVQNPFCFERNKDFYKTILSSSEAAQSFHIAEEMLWRNKLFL